MLDAGDLDKLMSGLRNNNLLNYTHILTGEEEGGEGGIEGGRGGKGRGGEEEY